jgi:hypothetical protein
MEIIVIYLFAKTEKVEGLGCVLSFYHATYKKKLVTRKN